MTILSWANPEQKKVAAEILEACLNAYEDGLDWVGYQNGRLAAYGEEKTPCDPFYERADAFSLPGLITRMAVLKTDGITQCKEYQDTVELGIRAMNDYVWRNSPCTNVVMWNNWNSRKRDEVLEALRQVVKSLQEST